MADNPFRYVAEKLMEPAGEDLWPLAILWFDPATKGLKCSVANVGAELVVGHGRKIGLIIESTARQLCKEQLASGSAERAKRRLLEPPSPPPPVTDAGGGWNKDERPEAGGNHGS